MQEQNFEQNVRHKLDELLLPPAPPVWEAVALELRKKKDRRRLGFFLLLATMLTGIVLYLGGGAGNLLPARQGSVPQKKGAPAVVSAAAGPTREDDREIETPKANDRSAIVENNKVIVTPSNIPVAERSRIRTSTRLPVPLTGPSSPLKMQRVRVVASTPLDENFTAATTPSEPPSVPVNEAATVRSLVKVDSLPMPSLPDPAVCLLSPFAPTFNQTSVQAAPTVQKKWTWSFHADAGISGSRGSIFNGEQPARADYQTGSGGLSPTASPNARPAQVRNGRTYSAGLDVQRSIGKKTWFVTGLHYRLAQTRVLVGATRNGDTSVRNNSNAALSVSEIYFAGAAQQLTNKYHFLEIPVGIQWQPFRRVPLIAQLSATGARIIAADAVVFGTQSRVYYKEKKAFHNNQLYLGAGMDYRILKNSGFSLRAGPYVQYGITTLERKGWSDQHLFATGIKTNISF